MKAIASCVVACALSSALTGCWHGPDSDRRCVVVSIRPADASTEVAIRPTMRVEWSDPVDLSRARVTVRSTSGDEIPVTVSGESERVAVVTADRSLRFDTGYTIEVESSARDVVDETCETAAASFHTVVPRQVAQPMRPASLEGLVRVDHYLLGTSRAYRGLQIFDIGSDVAGTEPVLVGALATDVHPAGIVLAGDRAYLPSEHGGVLIVDVRDPAQPVVIGRAGTPGVALDVAPFTRGDTLYIAVADGVEGVRILDVTEAAVPRLVAVFDPSAARAADVKSVAIDGELMAVADGARGYVVVDLADPASPVSLGAGSTGQAAIDVEIHGGLVYVAHFPAFIDIYDPRVAGLPRVGGTRACDVCMQRYPVVMHLSGDRLHVTEAREGVRSYALDGDGGMTEIALRATPGPAFSVVETADRLYVGEEGGLVTFDRATAGAPLHVASGHGIAGSVAVRDGVAYVASASRGLQIFSVIDPEAPALVAGVATPASPVGDTSAAFVAATADTLLVGDVRGGLVTFDRSGDPTAPTTMGQVQAHDGITKLIPVRDGVVIGCQGNTGMLLADVSDPRAPVVIAEEFFRDFTPPTPDYCIDLTYDAATGLAYIAGNQGVTVIEVGAPGASDLLKLVGRFPTPARDIVLSVARRGDRLYATTQVPDLEGRNGYTSRLQVFDVSDPRAPVWQSASADLGAMGRLTLVDDLGFAAARDLGVYIFDLSSPDQPVVEYLVPTSGDAVSVTATADTLYLAQSAGGLSVIHTGPLPVGGD